MIPKEIKEKLDRFLGEGDNETKDKLIDACDLINSLAVRLDIDDADLVFDYAWQYLYAEGRL